MNWPTLNNPPIVLAVMELKFDLTEDIKLDFLKSNEIEVLAKYPFQNKNFEGNLKLPSPTPGKSLAQIESHQTGYSYSSQNKLRKIIVSKNNLVFINEGSYPGWKEFSNLCYETIDFYSFLLKKAIIKRISMRFINKFNFEKLDSPLDYLNTFISAKEGIIEFPIINLNYKYVMQIPESNIKINVIQSVEEKDEEGYKFLFDIDVLVNEMTEFQYCDIKSKLENIRIIKNNIFFKNLTDKSINLLK